VGGNPAPDGTMVQAKIDGEVVAECPVNGGEGKYGYNPILCFVTDPENNRQGKEIHFYINGIDTNVTSAFENGASKRLDFSLPNVEAGTIEKSESDVITSKTVVIVPGVPTEIKMGDSLTISLESSDSTNAVIEKIEKLGTDFFTGAAAVISGKNLLNGYEIKVNAGDNVDIKVTMKYDDTGIDEDTIAPYKFDGNSWVAIEPFTIDKSANTVTFSISSASTPYVVFGSLASTGGGTTGGEGGTARGGGVTVSDTTAPLISDINVEANRTTAEINWKTNEPSISWILYGTTTDYGKEIRTTTYTTSHSITITDLTPGTTYHFQIKSRDSAGNIRSTDDRTFVTLKPRITGDINDDGKVDKYDFALMMSEWGKTGLNISSDLNKDGKVDKYDFSLLMVNWTK
ncbi:MAG: fibronectin type III domain-containing protein, partial [Candidatus Omnitrophica bacterium]|nr:fibronectin type III domain-containing protein [Candidatus Omnitrophota bacterium]